MRFKKLADLKRAQPREVILAELPREIAAIRYCLDKAFKINELVRDVHHQSFEWYGFTLGSRNRPELVADVGLPGNLDNVRDYANISPELIAAYQESLPEEVVINGWIHSHGDLEFKGFSTIDEANQMTVLDYVTARLRLPVAKREVLIKDLALLTEGRYAQSDLEQGTVCLITDAPVSRARIMETVYGGFCFSIVVGDDGWRRQEILYKTRSVLSGQTTVSRRTAEIEVIDTGKTLTAEEIEVLRDEVRQKIKPITYTLPKLESV
ncbi:MAG: hypothetical protein FJ134_05275 [Deltaproteobacteria bacterium]|nr:hypothetical protein [Deltaproteobacteria bacterium]